MKLKLLFNEKEKKRIKIIKRIEDGERNLINNYNSFLSKDTDLIYKQKREFIENIQTTINLFNNILKIIPDPYNFKEIIKNKLKIIIELEEKVKIYNDEFVIKK